MTMNLFSSPESDPSFIIETQQFSGALNILTEAVCQCAFDSVCIAFLNPSKNTIYLKKKFLQPKTMTLVVMLKEWFETFSTINISCLLKLS